MVQPLLGPYRIYPDQGVIIISSSKNIINYSIAECDKTFDQMGQLSYHAFVAHAQLQARPHKCGSCPESFLQAHHLQVMQKKSSCHEKTATKIRTYELSKNIKFCLLYSVLFTVKEKAVSM